MKNVSRIARSRLAVTLVAVAAAVSGGHVMAADCHDTPSAGVDWSECTKKNLMLEGSDFEKANLAGADLSQTSLKNANLDAANFEKATLIRAWLEGAKADDATFDKIEAYRAVFQDASAQNSSFVSAELQRADFTRAQLSGANFEKAELGRATFEKAVLTGARFALANLSRVDLSGASFGGPVDFDRAFMFLTRIEGLDLSAATGLQQSQIELACGDASTKLPSGLTMPKDWPCATD
ncbi:pentapeptide repeat-containing protein [Rhizobium sullae]|uniref:Pentapeptide repeat-containing protein n=1 Tax=Rhizobium sullae TaxID=50338 RepID=A0A2N0D0Y8_RHISU|nr:pentapeptide repeat-containing protein [Rhizobium sullae]PKA39712.1 pentapeptide repeat-containing protein [Rhizobium sullae]UWU16138.1 pentapeptide repeat-containing protein [Rhizobium sullae]